MAKKLSDAAKAVGKKNKEKMGPTGFKKVGWDSRSGGRPGMKKDKAARQRRAQNVKLGGTQQNRKELASFIREHRSAARSGRTPSTTNIYGWSRRGPERDSKGEQRREPFIAPHGTPVTGAAGKKALTDAYKNARKQQGAYYKQTRGSYKRKNGQPVDYGKAAQPWMRKFLRSASANLVKRRASNAWRNEHVKGGKVAKMHEAWQKRRAAHGPTGKKTG